MSRIRRGDPIQLTAAQREISSAAKKLQADSQVIAKANKGGATQLADKVANEAEHMGHLASNSESFSVLIGAATVAVPEKIGEGALRLYARLAQAFGNKGAQTTDISRKEIEPFLKDFANAKGLERAILGELGARTSQQLGRHLLPDAKLALDDMQKQHAEIPEGIRETAKAFVGQFSRLDTVATLEDAQAFRDGFRALPPEQQEAFRPALYAQAFDGNRPRAKAPVTVTQTLYETLASPESAAARLDDLVAQVDWSGKKSSSGGKKLDSYEVSRIVGGLAAMPEEERGVAQAAVKKALFKGTELRRELASPSDYENLYRAVFAQ